MFYEAMEDVMPNMKIIIEGSDGSLRTAAPAAGAFQQHDDSDGGISR